MSVLALGDGLYEVDSTSGATYLVDLEASRCSCPDHFFRDARCKHLRRVAIEITEGRTPPPGQLAVSCTDCGATVFRDETRQDPAYCSRHELHPGELARDRETGDRLVVVAVADRRADSVTIGGSDRTVADYGTNESYEPHEPVIGAIYPHATVTSDGTVPPALNVYVFPRTRLRRIVRTR